MLPVIRSTRDSWLPDVFNDFFDNSWMERPTYTAPAINVLETEKEYDVELAAPGLDKKDFKVHVDLLPDDAEADKIEAKVEKGVLNVHIPKKEKAQKEEAVKQIDIQ